MSGLSLSPGSETEIDIVGGQYVEWAAISRHPNSKACKPWMQRITDTHEKYGVDGEWIDKQYIDGNVAFDVSGLGYGDIIKVSGASHSNKKNAYYAVKGSDGGSLSVMRMKEEDVLERLNSSEGSEELASRARDLRDALANLTADSAEYSASVYLNEAEEALDRAIEDFEEVAA